MPDRGTPFRWVEMPIQVHHRIQGNVWTGRKAWSVSRERAAATETLSAVAARPIGFWLSLAHIQSATAQSGAVRPLSPFLLYLSLASRQKQIHVRVLFPGLRWCSRFPPLHILRTYFATRVAGTVRQVTHIRGSSLGYSTSSGGFTKYSRSFLPRGPSESRAGSGRARMALVRASIFERTTEIRRQASRIPHRWDESLPDNDFFSSEPKDIASFSWAVWGTLSHSLAAAARKSGLPTRNMIRWPGIKRRISSQNFSVCAGDAETFMSTKL